MTELRLINDMPQEFQDELAANLSVSTGPEEYIWSEEAKQRLVRALGEIFKWDKNSADPENDQLVEPLPKN